MVTDYSETGTIGPIGQSCPSDVSGIPNQLNMRSSVSVCLFREDASQEYREKFDIPKEQHVPSSSCDSGISTCAPPGEGCADCKKRRTTWLTAMRDFRFAIKGKRISTNGKMNELTALLIWGDFVFRSRLL